MPTAAELEDLRAEAFAEDMPIPAEATAWYAIPLPPAACALANGRRCEP